MKYLALILCASLLINPFVVIFFPPSFSLNLNCSLPLSWLTSFLTWKLNKKRMKMASVSIVLFTWNRRKTTCLWCLWERIQYIQFIEYPSKDPFRRETSSGKELLSNYLLFCPPPSLSLFFLSIFSLSLSLSIFSLSLNIFFLSLNTLFSFYLSFQYIWFCFMLLSFPLCMRLSDSVQFHIFLSSSHPIMIPVWHEWKDSFVYSLRFPPLSFISHKFHSMILPSSLLHSMILSLSLSLVNPFHLLPVIDAASSSSFLNPTLSFLHLIFLYACMHATDWMNEQKTNDDDHDDWLDGWI